MCITAIFCNGSIKNIHLLWQSVQSTHNYQTEDKGSPETEILFHKGALQSILRTWMIRRLSDTFTQPAVLVKPMVTVLQTAAILQMPSLVHADVTIIRWLWAGQAIRVALNYQASNEIKPWISSNMKLITSTDISIPPFILWTTLKGNFFENKYLFHVCANSTCGFRWRKSVFGEHYLYICIQEWISAASGFLPPSTNH